MATRAKTRRDEDARPKSVLSFRALYRLYRAIVVRNDANLSADEAASTLFRFFRSRHVIDLRLIVTLAVLTALFHFITVLGFAVAKPAIHIGTALVNGKIGGAYDGWSAILRHISWILGSRGVPALGTLFAPAIPVYGGILAWAYLGAAKRLGVVDLFACEIGTLCRVGTLFGFGSLYVEKFKQVSHPAEGAGQHHVAPLDGKPADDKHAARPKEHEAFVSQEDYFPVFAGNSSDLQALEALVVANITEFYTYMKASRDLLRKIGETDPQKMPAALANLIYILFLGYEAGRKSVKHLVEFEPTRAEDTVVILLTELVCYNFLRQYFATQPDDVRNRRLGLREKDYKTEVPQLYRTINAQHGDNERYWQPAQETIDELAKRYNETFGETIAATLDKIDEEEQRKLRAERRRRRLPAFSPRF